MNAQLKPNELAALEARLSNRRSDVFEIDLVRSKEIGDGIKDDRLSTVYGSLLEEIHAVLEREIRTILASHATLDENETGRLVHECIGGFAIRRARARQAEEMLRNEFLPSWATRDEL
jgi:hypothetical protein